MMRRIILASVALVAAAALPSIARAQGGILNDSVLRADGRPAVGSTVRVCTEAAGGLPCSPLASIFTDKALTVAKSNPFATDSAATYFYYAAPGFYREEICLSGTCVTRIIQINVDKSIVLAPLLPQNSGDDLGSISKPWELFATAITASTISASTSISVGTNPAQSGPIRLPNEQYLTGRNVANTADLGIIGINVNNDVALGPSGVASFVVPVVSDSDLGKLTARWDAHLDDLSVYVGVKQQAGMQHKRVLACTTAATQFATCDATVTWDVAFVDTLYTNACTLDSTGATGQPTIQWINTRTAASITVRIVALTAVAATGTLNCVAMHD